MPVIASTTASDGGMGFSLSIMRPSSGCAQALSSTEVLYSGAVQTYGLMRSLMSVIPTVLSSVSERLVAQALQLPLRQPSAKATISLVALEKASCVFTSAGCVLYSSRV